jgi:mannose-6-phosphate isomerase-like protein (cupin superfamily)
MPHVHDPAEVYVHLHEGPEVTLEPLTESFWSDIGERTELHRGRLLTSFSIDDDWTVWEMHPTGDEIILVTEGTARFHLDDGDTVAAQLVAAPDYLVVPAGTWHTMDAIDPGRAVIITWGEGTTHRPR